jgi:NTE family protein
VGVNTVPDSVADLELAIAPVSDLGARNPEQGIGLCLSGGGYRAMIFHVGALIRLNETGYLSQLKRVSGVSGGSITAALLGIKWKKLDFHKGQALNLIPEVVDPIRVFAHQTVDVPSVITGALLPGTISDKMADAYRKYLLGDATLQDLPNDPPRFEINATNVQSGSLVCFSKPYMRDYKVGEIRNPTIALADAVTASSAFPPFLSPAFLDLNPEAFSPTVGASLAADSYRKRMVLSDGGIYDKLGVETVWKHLDTVLVSDGGGKFSPNADAAEDWLRHNERVLDVIDDQVHRLRKRQLISSLEAGLRKGCYWGITSNIADYKLASALPCPVDRTSSLAAEPTRLSDMSDRTQERLINWGYAVCDAALRRHLDPSPKIPAGFPYSGGV